MIKGDGTILLFNPLGESRRDVVDIELLDWDEKNGSTCQILDSDDNVVPSQLQKNENGKYQVTIIPELKPFSWSRFYYLAL